MADKLPSYQESLDQKDEVIAASSVSIASTKDEYLYSLLGKDVIITVKHSKLALDARHASVDSGELVQQWTRNGKEHQKFTILETKLDDGTVVFEIVNRNSMMLLDVWQASKEAGAEIRQYPRVAKKEGDHWTRGLNQKFLLMRFPDDGSYAIMSALSGKALDVDWASAEKGSKIIQWHFHGKANQRFFIELAE
jgi:hypothetical protein